LTVYFCNKKHGLVQGIAGLFGMYMHACNNTLHECRPCTADSF
jgi:hypothetical protein